MDTNVKCLKTESHPSVTEFFYEKKFASGREASG